jgi:hypothetical protein
MRMHSIATILICAMVASSCATQNRQMTRQEFLSVSTKTYPHHDAEQVLAAAETILRLADSDYQFMHSQNGMKASRFWQRYMFLYLAQGNDYWTIEALPSDAGVRVSAQINTGFSGTNILPTTGGDLSASAGSSIAVSAIGSATYLLFLSAVAAGRMARLQGLAAAQEVRRRNRHRCASVRRVQHRGQAAAAA